MCLRVQLLLVTLCSILVFFSSNPSAATISLPLIALPCLVCLASQKKRKERNTTACVISGRADALHPFFFCFGSHLPVHRLCISFSKFKTKKRGLPNPDRLQLRKFWSLWQSYHTKGRPDLLVTGIPLPFLKSVCGNLLICIPLFI